MWRPLIQRLGVVLHKELIQQSNSKKINGVFHAANGNGLSEGEIIGLVPFAHCLAPNIAIASPWGKSFVNYLSSYSVEGDGVRVEYSKESSITTVFCALSIFFPQSPLHDYLDWITLEGESEAQLEQKLGESSYTHLKTIRGLNRSIIEALIEDCAKAGWQIPVATMERAHAICSSRCTDVPRSEDIFGGPALVPFVDLINHAKEEPNVVVYMDTQRSVAKDLQSMGPNMSSEFRNFLCEENGCPLCVVVRCAKDIIPGEELHYCYSQDCSDPLFWASRFHFLP